MPASFIPDVFIQPKQKKHTKYMTRSILPPAQKYLATMYAMVKPRRREKMENGRRPGLYTVTCISAPPPSSSIAIHHISALFQALGPSLPRSDDMIAIIWLHEFQSHWAPALCKRYSDSSRYNSHESSLPGTKLDPRKGKAGLHPALQYSESSPWCRRLCKTWIGWHLPESK